MKPKKQFSGFDLFDKSVKHLFDNKTGERIGYNVNGQITIFAEHPELVPDKKSVTKNQLNIFQS